MRSVRCIQINSTIYEDERMVIYVTGCEVCKYSRDTVAVCVSVYGFTACGNWDCKGLVDVCMSECELSEMSDAMLLHRLVDKAYVWFTDRASVAGTMGSGLAP